jgi:hypothetical protein
MLFMASKLSRGISNCTTILHQYSSNTRVECITIHIKRLLDDELNQYRCRSEELLQSEKDFFVLRAPFELDFLLYEFDHWLGNLREVWDESVIISH